MLPLVNKLDGRRPVVWAFVSYMVKDGRLAGDSYDTEIYKVEVAQAFQALGLAWIWQPVVSESLDDVVAQVVKHRQRAQAIVFNFCDGDDVHGYPGLSVLERLEAAGVPFTGADSTFYEISTSKVTIKEALIAAGVPTAPYAILPRDGDVTGLCGRLGSPLLVKPAVSAAGWGMSLKSVVSNDEEIAACHSELTTGPMAEHFSQDTLFVERFLDGPEYTVFVGGYWDQPDEIWTLPPAERIFDPAIPDRERILCNDRLGRPFYHYEACAERMNEPLCRLAIDAYRAVKGFSYGRVDIRQDRATGELFVLEVNANPGISGDEELVSVGCILKLAGRTFPELMGAIIGQSLVRSEQLATAQSA